MARDTSKLVTIPGELHSAATGNIVAAAEEVFDYTKNMYQKDINQEVAYIKEDSSVAPIPSFNPQSQTVHLDEQVLSNAQKKQVRKNIGLGNGDIDSTPTSGSDNVVRSGGVYSSMQELRSTINPQVGYYTCSTAGNTAAKVIDASGYTLLKGGGLRVSFTEKNTAANATLNIEQTGAKSLYYNGVRVSTNNSWYAGEVMTLFYDGAVFQLNSLPDLDEYDVSARNGGQAFTFDEAVALVPEAYRHGGLKLRFISNSGSGQSSDNKYVQYRLMAQNFTTDVSQWQGVSNSIVAGSEDLSKSGDVKDAISEVGRIVGIDAQYNLTIPYNSSYALYYDTAYYIGDYKAGDKVEIWILDENHITTDDENITIYACNKDAGDMSNIGTVGHVNSKYIFTLGVDTKYVTFFSRIAGTGTLKFICKKANSVIGIVDEIESVIGKGANFIEGFSIAKTGTALLKNDNYCVSKKVTLTDEMKSNGFRFYNGVPSSGTNDSYICLFDTNDNLIDWYGQNPGKEYSDLSPSDLLNASYFILNFVSGYNARITTLFSSTDTIIEFVKHEQYEYRLQKASRDIETNRTSIETNRTSIETINRNLDLEISDVEGMVQESLYYKKTIDVTERLNPNTNLYPVNIKKGSVVQVTFNSEAVGTLNGIYLKDALGNELTRQYNLSPNNKYTLYASDNVAGISVWFETANFNPGYTSGSIAISICIDNTQRYLVIPTTNTLQHMPISANKGECVRVRFNGDEGKVTKIKGVYLQKNGTDIVAKFNVPLGKWLYFENLTDDIDNIDVFTTSDQVTAQDSVIVDILYGTEMAQELAFDDRSVLLAISDDRMVIPSYYFANDYLNNKISRINKLAQEADDTFVFTTDEHWGYNAQVSPAIIKYLERYCNFSRMISTGDHVQNINEYSKAELNKLCFDYMHLLEQINKPKYSSIGNHAYLTSVYASGVFDGVNLDNWVKYAFYLNYKDVVVGDNDWMYFYLDDNVKKLRYVFLNTFEAHEEETVGNNKRTIALSKISSTQLSWFENTALNVESGYGVIVVVHSIVGVAYTNQSTNDQIIYIDQDAGKGLKACANIILNYNGNADFIVVMSGHTHRDGIDMVDDTLVQNTGASVTNNAFFNLCSTCDAYAFPASMPTEIIPHRHGGTISETAFDVCMLNRNKHRIDMVRIGDPANLVYNYNGTLEERAVVYQIQNVAVGGTKSLEHDITGTASWSSANTSVATVNDGVVTGVSAGFAKITVEDTTNHRAIVYMVKVS